MITEKIKQWLDSEPRDPRQGALLLLQCTGNQIAFRNMVNHPERYADILYRALTNQYQFRLHKVTHEQVEQMAKQVEPIIKKRGLDRPTAQPAAEQASEPTGKQSKVERQRRGQRSDHDQLPDDIKQLYIDNMRIIQKMRDLHTQLRLISQKGSPTYCPDSDRYPLLKELIALDIQYRNNWSKYDKYENKK